MEQLKNFAQSTLSANIISTDTTLTVGDGTAFPSTGTFRLLIGSELMKATARSSGTITVVRGQEGSTAASHTSGDTVVAVLTAAGIDQWIADNHLFDTCANLPTAGKPGRIFFPTDWSAFAIDDGTEWNWFTAPLGMNFGAVPPISSDFIWINQGSASVDASRGGLIITDPPESGYHIRALSKSKTAPYTITMQFNPLLTASNQPSCGMGFTDGTKAFLIEMVNASGDNYLQVMKLSDFNTLTTQPAFNLVEYAGTNIRWLQIEDDGTTLHFRFSHNGQQWLELYSESRTTQFTSGPTGVFFHICAQNTTWPAVMHVAHWKET